MSNVIDFATREPRRPDASQGLAAKRRRAEALRRAIKGGEAFAADDQELVARNLHGLIEALVGEGRLTKRDLVVQARVGGNGSTDSTKRLDTYTFPEDGTASRRGRLAKKPGKYLAFATALAGLTGGDESTWLCRIFEGTSFGTGAETASSPEEDRWSRLADLLRQMAAAVVRDEEVERYWSQALTLNGSYDPVSGTLALGPLPMDVLGCATGLAGARCWPGDVPPLASVLLADRSQMPLVAAELIFDGGDVVEAVFDLRLEVRLALGPVNDREAVGLMVEFRSRLDAFNTEAGEPIVFDNVHSDGSGGSDWIGSATIAGRTFKIAAFPFLGAPEAEFRDGCEHAYYGWEEVSPALLRSIFEDPNHTLRACVRDDRSPHDLPPNRFLSGTAVFHLYADLLTGRLEDDLRAACREVAAKVAQLQREAEEAWLAAETTAEARWTAPARNPSRSAEANRP